jgi:preprotein translocase subunit SecA
MKNELNELVKELLEEIFDEMIQEQLKDKEKETLKMIKRMSKEKRDAIYETVTGLEKETNIKAEKIFERLMNYCNEDFEKLADFCSNKEVKANNCCACIVSEEVGGCTIDTNVWFND